MRFHKPRIFFRNYPEEKKDIPTLSLAQIAAAILLLPRKYLSQHGLDNVCTFGNHRLIAAAPGQPPLVYYMGKWESLDKPMAVQAE